jgi:hypothetical protein
LPLFFFTLFRIPLLFNTLSSTLDPYCHLHFANNLRMSSFLSTEPIFLSSSVQ